MVFAVMVQILLSITRVAVTLIEPGTCHDSRIFVVWSVSRHPWSQKLVKVQDFNCVQMCALGAELLQICLECRS